MRWRDFTEKVRGSGLTLAEDARCDLSVEEKSDGLRRQEHDDGKSALHGGRGLREYELTGGQGDGGIMITGILRSLHCGKLAGI